MTFEDELVEGDEYQYRGDYFLIYLLFVFVFFFWRAP